MKGYTYALQFRVNFELKTPLLLRSGKAGEFTDSSIEKTEMPDGFQKLHINGYVWSSLLRRALGRTDEGKNYAQEVGKYDATTIGVSPLWCSSSYPALPDLDVRPGIKIDRKYGTASVGALYNDEIVPPGLKIPLNFTYFFKTLNDKDKIKEAFSAALYVINEQIENIGGGWSYGFGRLTVEKAEYRCLYLKEIFEDENGRTKLWNYEGDKFKNLELKQNNTAKSWQKWTVKAKILDGQLLAVHMNHPLTDSYQGYEHLPDTFVFRRLRINGDGKASSEIVIPGKAIRQALFSVPIERKLRTKGEVICETPGEFCTCKTCEDYRKEEKKKDNSPKCQCKRCKWFGSTEAGGIIAVLDAIVENKNTKVINRIQLCEHSMQNINLFSGEYLTSGSFDMEIIVDRRENSDYDELIKNIAWVLNEMKKDGPAPPGWYRLGATSTCTGQVEVTEMPQDLKQLITP